MSAKTPQLESVLHSAQLAALPQSAIRLLELSQDPNNGPAEFAAPIEADPGLAGQVLRFVNSSYFGFAQEISSVKLAITLVGVRTIKNFALWSAVFSLMPNPKCGPFDLKFLWQDSLRRGIFSRAVARMLKLPEAEDLFAAALLQDMAVPLLAKDLSKQYSELLMMRQEGDIRLSDLEQQEFGWNHAQAAAMMARNWKLSENFITLLEDHTRLNDLSPGRQPEAGRFVVALSSLLPSSCDSRWQERDHFVATFDQHFAGRVSLPEMIAAVDREFADFAPVIRIPACSRPLGVYFGNEETVPA